MKRDKNWILWPLFTITKFVKHIHTDRRTWQLYEKPGPVGGVSENLFKFQFIVFFGTIQSSNYAIQINMLQFSQALVIVI